MPVPIGTGICYRRADKRVLSPRSYGACACDKSKIGTRFMHWPPRYQQESNRAAPRHVLLLLTFALAAYSLQALGATHAVFLDGIDTSGN